MANIPFLYGELNKQVEYLRYKFKSTDGSALILQNDKDHSVDILVNVPNFSKIDTQKIVTLKQVKKDQSQQNPNLKYYRLYAYNDLTKEYDIEIGDEIVIDTTIDKIPTSSLIDYKIMIDENGNEIKIPIESVLDGNSGGVY